MTEAERYLVAGPSSAGKSTFVASPHRERYLPGTADFEIVFPGGLTVPPGSILHYNIMNPVLGDARRALQLGQDLVVPTPCYRRDQICPDPESSIAAAVVVVTPAAALRDRVEQRTTIEPEIPIAYRRTLWEAIYAAADVTAVYRAFLDALESWDLPYVLIDGTSDEFTPLRTRARAELLLEGGEVTSGAPTKLARNDTGQPYQSGGDLSIPGSYDRSQAIDLVFDRSMIGSSVLDVGCAEGLFCFEAEARGASRVVGIDLKPDRLERAAALAESIVSAVEFRLGDLLDLSGDEAYDVVLLLNVLHHVDEPVATLRASARLARHALILEYPTLVDPKFGRTIEGTDLGPYNDLPLIGVSTSAVDQTFVFTDAAVERILREHAAHFDEITFGPSPNPARRMAYARRNPGGG